MMETLGQTRQNGCTKTLKKEEKRMKEMKRQT